MVALRGSPVERQEQDAVPAAMPLPWRSALGYFGCFGCVGPHWSLKPWQTANRRSSLRRRSLVACCRLSLANDPQRQQNTKGDHREAGELVKSVNILSPEGFVAGDKQSIDHELALGCGPEE